MMRKKKGRPVEKSFMHTRSGKAVNIVSPVPADISLRDIAWSLSTQARFLGHANDDINTPYTVAQHCLFVASRFKQPHLRLYALLHDAAEAYVGDVTIPVKRILGPGWNDIEHRVLSVIYKSFGLTVETPVRVREADRRAAATEFVRFFDMTPARARSLCKAEPYEDMTPIRHVLSHRQAFYAYLDAVEKTHAEIRRRRHES